MKSHTEMLFAGTAALAALLLTSTTALAGNARSWVASAGKDTNPCTLAEPCATLGGALAKTDSGGEIDALDAGDYSGTTGVLNIVNQSVIIDGRGVGSFTSFATASSSDGLGLCVYGGTVTIRNMTFLADANAAQSIYIGSGVVNVDNVHIEGGQLGVGVGGGTINITDSLIHNPANVGIQVAGDAPASTRVRLDNVRITGALSAGVEAPVGTIMVNNCLLAGDANGLFSFGLAVIYVSNSTITGNSQYGFAPFSGKIVSFGNNRLFDNQNEGTPTSVMAQK